MHAGRQARGRPKSGEGHAGTQCATRGLLRLPLHRLQQLNSPPCLHSSPTLGPFAFWTPPQERSELHSQLVSNDALSDSDRRLLGERLAQIDAKLAVVADAQQLRAIAAVQSAELAAADAVRARQQRRRQQQQSPQQQ
jgi:hypothetical protein